ncbi:MAG: magnesium-translocating P-type ATPase [Acidobacteria bacterium]|nr:magnesium-translocating P-type ATPase [Acidobacteriota bacterium]MCW5950003.1 magnesium-translocating P-type ATPase [Pyrinomonadaceae bacterium]
MKETPTASEIIREAPERGMTSTEAARAFEVYGPNEPIRTRRANALVDLLRLFANPLIILLIVASGISLAVGDVINASIIISMVLLGVFLNFFQTRRSKKAADSLRREVSVSARVLRDGRWSEVPRREVVPGDLIRISAGGLVPADAVLVETRGLHVQEAALTGESLPVEKAAASSPEPTDAERVFLGTSVISGTATARVVATGPDTRFGEIASRLVQKPPETEFERGTKKFGFFIVRVIFVLVVFVFLVNALMQRDILESLLFSIALAVGLTPEFLPMITTVTLGQGAIRMAAQKVIVKNLEAIQNFGSIDILCCDKTGTLTKGEMSLKDHVDPQGKPSEEVFRLGWINSALESGVTDVLSHGLDRSKISDPLDAAIIGHDTPQAGLPEKLDELPFDFERRRVSVVVIDGGQARIITKGAPESIMSVCTGIRTPEGDQDLRDGAADEARKLVEGMSRRGLRVIAVAAATVATRERYTAADEQGLTLEGFLVFADEPRESAAEALRSLADDGVEVKILTGDSELAAGYVCNEVGLDAKRIINGDDIDKMDDAALAQTAEQVTVFARVSPVQKNRIILALKQRGHVVGFLGDGINDAPSLRTADVGISVASATDVAKDAAAIVMMEPGLDVLHSGIIEGRKSFGNVMKYLLMGTSSNFGNMFSMAAAVLFLPFLPMLPVQIVLNNFLYDLAQITIPTDEVDDSFIRKPRKWDISLIRDFMLYIGPISSIYDFATFYVLLHVFRATEQMFHTGWFIESLATQTLVVFVIRTAGNPFKSKPSRPLTITVIAVVLVACILPFTPPGRLIGFVPMTWQFYLFVAGATATYLLLVEMVKRKLMSRWGSS